jgi:P-type Ca2+ transporter type 2C
MSPCPIRKDQVKSICNGCNVAYKFWVGLVLQVFNEINSREMEKINVFKGILDNYVFVGVISATIFFQIIIVEYLGTFANTTPLTLVQWFFCLFVGFMGMPIAARLKKIPV